MADPGDGVRARIADLLRHELLRRTARNPRYSLRAYARFLGIDPATLSQLLRGRRAFTARTVQRLGLRLGLDEGTIAACQAAEARAGRAAPDASLRQLEDLLRDTVEIASDWYHHAILDLARPESFVPDSRRVASVLGLTVDEVNIAIQRLARLGLLEMKGARWIARTEPAADAQAFTADALIRCHELLGRLIAAQRTRPPEALPPASIRRPT
jgi:plasmid maintenance system antidote protein VapI